MAAVRRARQPERIGLRLAGEEVFKGLAVDHGEDIVIGDGIREERVSKTMARRFVTQDGDVIYMVNLDFPAVTKAEELATLEERICFDALNGSTQPKQEAKYSLYLNIACVVLCLVVVFMANAAGSAANKALAVANYQSGQINHIVQVLDKVAK